MTVLAPTDRTKLARVLALLGSPHQGERDAAALAADRMVRGRGLSWADVLMASQAHAEVRFSYSPQRSSPYADLLGDLRACGQRLDLLTAWEREFVTSLSQRRTVSAKQRCILTDIAAKVRASGPRAG